jgi:CubicO group peptidase (beta-lactamase class C family)
MPLGNFSERYSPKEDIPSLEESLLKEAILVKEPGSSFAYSNVGFNLLELVIEKVTGRDFAKYMKEEVLLPLGMEEADFVWSEKWEPPVPFGYTIKGNQGYLHLYHCRDDRLFSKA